MLLLRALNSLFNSTILLSTSLLDVAVAVCTIFIFIACCYGVARFIVQNKQATTLLCRERHEQAARKR